jgi:class 3 adenylate cyclase
MHQHLSEMSGDGSCGMCQIDFDNVLDKNIGVTFTIVESLIPIPEEFLKKKKQDMYNAINANMDEKMKIAAQLKLQEFVSGMDCLHIKGFRDLFDNDTLPIDESLSIKNVSLMFTDIKGSTALYARVGDAKAYKLIRDHFEILFGIVNDNNGIVIKTIGDAVMASFKNPVDCTNCALDINKAFKEFDTKIQSEKEFHVKVGIHKGPALMVTLNNRIDYFGQTVNMAARIQGKAQNNQILLSEKLFNDKDVINVLSPRVRSLQPINVQLKGIEGRSKLFILNFKI